MGSTPEQVRAETRRFGLAQEKCMARGFITETPQRLIEIDIPIAIGWTDVTRDQWYACVADGGCYQGRKDPPRKHWIECMDSENCTQTPDDRIRFRRPFGPHQWNPQSPIVGVTFLEMQEYVAWLNSNVAKEAYRLPTEPEWEYAARAGTTTSFAQGDTLRRKQANFFVFRRDFVDGKPVFTFDPANERKLVPVHEFDAANAWGLLHMSGNVDEMTRSCWSD